MKYITIALVSLSAIGLHIKSTAQPLSLTDKALQQLHLKAETCKEELITEKVLPYDKSKSIVVIPKIAIEEEDGFSLDSYILLMDNTTGRIISRFSEPHGENGWESDAVRLSRITIDTAPYKIKDGERAFGIRVGFSGSSQPNPYEYESLSLFLPDGDSLRCVLKNFKISAYNGEWDTRCEGNFTDQQKSLQLSTTKTNNYYNLTVFNTITETTNILIKEECTEKNKIKTEKHILKYRNGQYQ